jgi:hypothetical protein
MYDYHNTDTRAERLAANRDHCGTPGPIYELARLHARGRIDDPERGGPLTTADDRRLIYAVDADLRVHVGFDGDRGTLNAVKHETLFHNAPVEAAGELEVADGIVVSINDHSGSYGTIGMMRVDRRMPRAVLVAMRRAKVPLSEAVVDFLEAQAAE